MTTNWNMYDTSTPLVTIETLAEEIGAICSEEELSERFDDEIVKSVIDQYGADDQIAINTAFNDWSDGLCKNDELHPLQYNAHTYVGEHSE